MPKKKRKEKSKLKFKYVVPDNLRDLYVNGLWGGVTPRAEIHMQFYNERIPIPNLVTCEVGEKGKLSEVDRDIGGDVVRVVQSSLVMDYSTAVAVRDWLNDRIKLVEAEIKKRI